MPECNLLGEEPLLTNPVATPCPGIINTCEKYPINNFCDKVFMLPYAFNPVVELASSEAVQLDSPTSLFMSCLSGSF